MGEQNAGSQHQRTNRRNFFLLLFYLSVPLGACLSGARSLKCKLTALLAFCCFWILLQTYVSTLVLKLQLLSSELNHSLREFSAKSLRNIPK